MNGMKKMSVDIIICCLIGIGCGSAISYSFGKNALGIIGIITLNWTMTWVMLDHILKVLN